MAGAKRTEPTIPTSHPEFRWTLDTDVQATWRRFGWLPTGRELVCPAPVSIPKFLVKER
jgi:hypothetical protein